MDKANVKQMIRNEIVSSLLKTQKFLIVGNWKMNQTKHEVMSFLDAIVDYDFGNKNKLVIVPSNPYLYLFEDKLRYSKILYGVQNVFPKNEGAFTGELSIQMTKDFGCKYAILGHSERRTLFNECDEFVSKKVRMCVQNQIIPILCIGENLEDRKNGNYKKFLTNQIKEGLSRISGEELKEVVIAYEPIWEIGTGETELPDQVEEINMFLRKFIIKEYGNDKGKNITLTYGGSVKPSNVGELALAQDVSGFLIGGASLESKTFKDISDILNGN